MSSELIHSYDFNEKIRYLLKKNISIGIFNAKWKKSNNWCWTSCDLSGE